MRVDLLEDEETSSLSGKYSTPQHSQVVTAAQDSLGMRDGLTSESCHSEKVQNEPEVRPESSIGEAEEPEWGAHLKSSGADDALKIFNELNRDNTVQPLVQGDQEEAKMPESSRTEFDFLGTNNLDTSNCQLWETPRVLDEKQG